MKIAIRFMSVLLSLTLLNCGPSDKDILKQFSIEKKLSELSAGDQAKALSVLRRNISNYYDDSASYMRAMATNINEKNEIEKILEKIDERKKLLLKEDNKILEIWGNEYPVDAVTMMSAMSLWFDSALKNINLVKRVDKEAPLVFGLRTFEDQKLKADFEKYELDLNKAIKTYVDDFNKEFQIKHNINPNILNALNSFLGIDF